MLTRTLLLSAVWLALSAITTFLYGTKVRTASRANALVWLLFVVAAGDVWALLTFGIPDEIGVFSLVALFIGALFIVKLRDWNALGATMWVMTLLATALYWLYIFEVTAFTPLHPLAYLIASVFLFFETAALLLGLSFAYETLDTTCRVRWHRRVDAFRPDPSFTPKVSIHLPAYNEPTEVVADTMRCMARLDYPNYEVLLIDNNTPDEAKWRPLEALCRELGPRFRCLHLDEWPGYKSGALNFALAQTAPDAEIIAVVDADYRLEPNFLSALTPAFKDPQLAFVQAPQDYRAFRGDFFMDATYLGYKYFFEVSMPSRNEHNAIIFAGTMGMVRKSVLQEIGGWDEWCITEDAELSLRILKRGYRSIFVHRSYGRGLMPFTFDGLKKQRFRWCFGGIQILRKHWEALMPWSGWVDPHNRLTLAQKYYYLMGGLQWFTDLLNLCFTAFLIAGALLLISPLGLAIRPLTGPLITMPLLFIVIGLWRFGWSLRHALHLGWREALRTMFGFFSLGWSVMLGSIQGLIQPVGVFLRTPKTNSRPGILDALRSAQWETLIGVTCVGMAAAVLYLTRLDVRGLFMAALLAWQASLHLAAPLFSLASIRSGGPEPLPRPGAAPVREVGEGFAARWALALAVLLMTGAVVMRFLPPPESPPPYSRLQPPDVPLPRVFGGDPLPINQRALTPTPTAVRSATPAPGRTGTPPPTPVSTAAATATRAPTSTPTSTAAATATGGPTSTPASTAVPTATGGPTPTLAATSTVTATLLPPTNTPLPAATP